VTTAAAATTVIAAALRAGGDERVDHGRHLVGRDGAAVDEGLEDLGEALAPVGTLTGGIGAGRAGVVTDAGRDGSRTVVGCTSEAGALEDETCSGTSDEPSDEAGCDELLLHDVLLGRVGLA
jgi:hypothetical protein